MSYQSLYRQYRSQTFDEVKGQSHVTNALKTAVAEGRHGHAYLFSGPRGTGKTSTARVLAKALNCENVTEGEPCNNCDSCTSITDGKSFDLHELDAASNNKVDDVRDLISKVHLGSPGRTKVYILDEVHMLSSGAENALLKTLEEPPPHVVFVLATTEPHKVVPTIRSRTQHFKFGLLPAEDLEAHLRYVADDAGFQITDEIITHVISEGGGSARDTLSALDLVIAGGGVPSTAQSNESIFKALENSDAEAMMLAVQSSLEHGLEPRVIGENLLGGLRNAFLVKMGAEPKHISATELSRCKAAGEALGPANLTRSLEAVGSALVDMRQAADPRISLEVALLKLCKTSGPLDETSSSEVDDLRNRVASLEAQLASGGSPARVPSKPVAKPVESSGQVKEGPAAKARLAAQEAASNASSKVPKPTPQVATAVKPQEVKVETAVEFNGDMAAAFEQSLQTVSQRVRARFRGGSFVSCSDGVLKFSAPNEIHQKRCEEVKAELEKAISAHTGQTITVDIGLDLKSTPPGDSKPSVSTKPDKVIDLTEVGPISELADANEAPENQVDRLKQVFPGAKVVKDNKG